MKQQTYMVRQIGAKHSTLHSRLTSARKQARLSAASTIYKWTGGLVPVNKDIVPVWEGIEEWRNGRWRKVARATSDPAPARCSWHIRFAEDGYALYNGGAERHKYQYSCNGKQWQWTQHCVYRDEYYHLKTGDNHLRKTSAHADMMSVLLAELIQCLHDSDNDGVDVHHPASVEDWLKKPASSHAVVSTPLTTVHEWQLLELPAGLDDLSW